MLTRTRRTRLFCESLEARDNPSVPGGETPPYSPPPGPAPTDVPGQTAPVVPPSDGGSTLPGSQPPYTPPTGG